MNRRDFFRESFKFLGTAASTYLLGKASHLAGAPQNLTNLPDLVAIKGAAPDVLFDQAIAQFGGMSQFVRKGQKVLVKPNIGWSQTPDKAANTNPKLVKRIIEHCVAAGASKVYAFDNTCNYWEDSYRISGIASAVKEGGGVIVPGHKESYYHPVKISGAKTLTHTKIHELYLEADVIINVPILKNHSSADLTIAMKNLMGVVWDRWFYHSNGLHQCIADFCLYRKPTLNVVDAYAVLTRHGPRGGSIHDVALKKMLLISPDIVAIDSAACRILDKNPQIVQHIQIGHEQKVGNMDLNKLKIKRMVL